MNIYSHFSANGTKLVPFPFVSELAMEGYIVEHPDVLKLPDDDEKPHVLELEKDWKRGEKGRGRIDLLVRYGDSTFAVVELKKDELDLAALDQLNEYFTDGIHLRSVADSFELSAEDKKPDRFPWLGACRT
jgi:RecB family endonuclease NucS